MIIKIRFNTDTLKTPDAGLPEWRVIYDGKEHLAAEVKILGPSWTTKDEISPDLLKWHITTEGLPEWDELNRVVTIRPAI